MSSVETSEAVTPARLTLDNMEATLEDLLGSMARVSSSGADQFLAKREEFLGMLRQTIIDSAAAAIGRHVERFALQCGWNRDDGEGAFEFVQRTSYRQGWVDGAMEACGDVHRDGELADDLWIPVNVQPIPKDSEPVLVYLERPLGRSRVSVARININGVLVVGNLPGYEAPKVTHWRRMLLGPVEQRQNPNESGA